MGGRRLFDFRRPDPRGADRPAPAVDDVPLRGQTVPRGVLRRIGVVKVRDPVVPLAGTRRAQVGPGHEARVGAHLHLGLEGVGAVRLVLVRRAPVHQEARHRTRPGGELRGAQAHRVDRPLGDVELQAAGAGDVSHDRRLAAAERNRQRLLVGSTPPDRRLAAVCVFYLDRRVVAPAHRDGQLAAPIAHEEAEPYRRREERLARRLPLVVRLLGQSGRLGHGVEVVVLVCVATPVGRRTGRDQEAGHVPVRRTLAARQLLGAELMIRPRSDQIELQGLDEARADLEGIGRSTVSGGHGRRIPYNGVLSRWWEPVDPPAGRSIRSRTSEDGPECGRRSRVTSISTSVSSSIKDTSGREPHSGRLSDGRPQTDPSTATRTKACRVPRSL